MSIWKAYTRSDDARRTGPIQPSAGSQFLVRFNGVGLWKMTTPWSDEAWDRLQPGGGIILRRDGHLVCSGPITPYGFDDPDDDESSVLVIEGVTDEIVLADSIVYPDPSRSGTQQTTQSHWRMTGPAENVLCALVDSQIGPGARPERRAVGLTVAPSLGRGQVVSAAIRYGAPNLLAELQILARAGGGLGFRVVATPDGGRQFQVYEPNDRAGSIRYGHEMGNVSGQTYRTSGPSATYGLVGGKGDLTARLQREATRTDAESARWRRRIETYVDARDTDDLADLDDRAAKSIGEDTGPKQSYSFTPVDTDNARLFEHVNLGDRVTVYAGPRRGKRVATFRDLVREIRGQLADNDDKLRAAVGDEGATTGVPLPTERDLVRIRADLQALKGSA